MTTTALPPQQRTVLDRSTARTTGALYLALALTGMAGYLVLRPVLVDPDPMTTVANLREHEVLARLRIAAELAMTVAQVLVALWFFRLFRPVDDFAAAAIAVFGTMNAVVGTVSAMFLATALEAALAGDAWGAASPQLLHELSANTWGVGNLFFGLWLVPMGWCVLRSAVMPRLLGWVLVVSGAGYVASAFVTYLLPDAGVVAELLTAPASVGEFWMLGYLLVRAGRR